MIRPRTLARAGVALVVAAIAVACSSATPTPAAPALGEGAVRFPATDGVMLQGRHFGEGDVGVILAHMFPADQESWAPFAETLAGEGFAAFTFNFRGYPPSEGAKEAERIQADLEGALEHLAERGVSDVFVIGASMGGTAAVNVAARRPFLGVVTLSAPTEFQGLTALEDGQRLAVPALIMAAEDDRTAQQSAAALFEAAAQPRILEIYAGGDHGTDLLYGQYGEQVRQRILDFLAANSP